MDGALTTQPRTPTVPPARSASASSMQSPPASAGSDRRQHLVPSVRPSRRSAEVEVTVDEFSQAQVPGEGGRQEQAGIGRQATVVKERCGYGRDCCCGSIYWVLLVSGRVSVPKPLSQIHRSTLCLLQGLSPRPSFGGFGLRERVKAGMDRARKQGKRIGRPRVTDRRGFSRRFGAILERVSAGDLSRRQAARELNIGYATLKRLLDAEGIGGAGGG